MASSLESSVLPSAPRVVAAYQPVTCVCAVDPAWWRSFSQLGGYGLPVGVPLFSAADVSAGMSSGPDKDSSYPTVSPVQNPASYPNFFGVLCGPTSFSSSTGNLVSVTIQGEVTASVDCDKAGPYTWCKFGTDPSGRTLSGTGGLPLYVLSSAAGGSSTEQHCFLLERGRKPFHEARVYLSLSALRGTTI